MTEHTTTDGERINQGLACLHGHEEAVDRLSELGWTDEQIQELEDYVHGYVDFAKCVVDEIRYTREVE